ncbi:MAG: ABC transporter permease [Lachnospiraceae bacterium]|nr:ABC transporter permease [Lachnospiraceae bacterium]
MSRFFYGKLAFHNLKKNIGLYLPYVVTAIGVFAMYYIMAAISRDEGLEQMPHAGDMQMILGMGCGVIAIFAVIFLFYTNSFLMKRRNREFGLFNILGMGKRHIGKMMFWETVMVAFVSILGGLAVGIALNKLVILVLLKITESDVSFGFSISLAAISSAIALFVGIFGATLAYNLYQVWKSKPIELLHSSNKGESEPKTRWLLALVGVLALGFGYGIAIWVTKPLEALLMFFLAVILVVLGTYCLFTAGSIALLKILRKNKGYYYRTSHFISVSGMIYRMKQNAVGLANICILSTMVLVMISGTLSLYIGMEDAVHTRSPRDISIKGREMTEESRAMAVQFLEQAAAESGLSVEAMTEYTSLSFSAWKKGTKFETASADDDAFDSSNGELCILAVVPLMDYERITGDRQDLKENEVLIYTGRGKRDAESIQFQNKTFQVKSYLQELNLEGLGTEVVYDVYFVVVKNSTVQQEFYEMQKAVYGEHASSLEHNIYADVSGTPEQSRQCAERIIEMREDYNAAQGEQAALSFSVDSKENIRESFLMLSGGFLFLGIFLGFVFLMATVMIIYYKQISEGYEDKGRFEIMQKVGMSRREVKGSIRSQILKIFFLPLLMACIHLTMAFPMLNRLVSLFGLYNVPLFALCTAATVGVFALIYGIVYGITAKAYYKIVE